MEESIIPTASEICIIHHIIQKPNLQRIIVILFIPNISKFLTPYFRRRLNSNIGLFLWPVSYVNSCFFLVDTPQKVDILFSEIILGFRAFVLFSFYNSQ